tara:strand:+ start:1316 stop:1576 length:261 start_codon:yes stop_codon:yes gene_type:complete
MGKKEEMCLENIERNLESIRKEKESNKAVLKIRDHVLALQNGMLTEAEFANAMADIALYNKDFKILTLLEACQHTLIVSKDIIQSS